MQLERYQVPGTQVLLVLHIVVLDLPEYSDVIMKYKRSPADGPVAVLPVVAADGALSDTTGTVLVLEVPRY